MATPNYGYEKRQRELAKKKKKEEKLKAKAEGKHHSGSEGAEAPDSDAREGGTDAPASTGGAPTGSD